ncbi:hypothetical protein FB45DRAFT_890888 [Roridomyces roridus]|uniref:Aminoglycoside phosphotransferase domain-containing protein n=1 Tax=Roridomyces roridus TaxID=1738132 RepID=A0AAD7FW50_9AGAR|nr:hypothetical protein FB45DRAFT_890888 [Roridomyces roridus]
MTTLNILCHIPGAPRPPGMPKDTPTTLSVVGDCDFPNEEWTVDTLDAIERPWISSDVYRAQITRPKGPDRPEDTVVQVVLKMDVVGGRRPVLLKEASVYKGEDGRALQGDMLPVFYGGFEATIEFNTVTCLVLEYCGEPMEKPFRDTDIAFLHEILLALRAMHRQGITHGDLHPRNILNYNGQPVFVDLELATLGHKCGTRIKLVPRTLVPSVREYGCAEMHDLIYRMGCWEPLNYIPKGDHIVNRPELEATAAQIFEQIVEERRITYGSDERFENGQRLDIMEELAD